MTSFITTPFGIFSIITLLLMLTTISVMLIVDRRMKLRSNYHSKLKPVLVYENAKFIAKNLKKAKMDEQIIRKFLVSIQMADLSKINTIVVDENQQILVFPLADGKNSYIEGFTISA